MAGIGFELVLDGVITVDPAKNTIRWGHSSKRLCADPETVCGFINAIFDILLLIAALYHEFSRVRVRLLGHARSMGGQSAKG